MRIISGTARGIRLSAPAGDQVRPTTDRVKESIFGILGDLRGTSVVDLFAGSGALGLEALSRGAARVVLVERDRRHVAVIDDNLARVCKSAGANIGQVEILPLDARRIPGRLPGEAGMFDIALADPPYSPGRGEMGPAELLRDAALGEWLGAALLVFEHPTQVELPWHPRTPWKLLRNQGFGSTTVSCARRHPAAD